MLNRGPFMKYVVRLNVAERLQLEDMIGTGRAAAYRLWKARILLKADVSTQSSGWDDARIAEPLGDQCFDRLSCPSPACGRRPGGGSGPQKKGTV